MQIKVLDNFFPAELINKLLIESEDYEWVFKRGDGNDDIYWTKHVYGSNFDRGNNHKILTEFTDSTVKESWDYFSNKFNIKTENLVSVYLNGLTNGTEAHQHIDSRNEKAVTVICYLCTDWNSHWSGETSFYDGKFSLNPADSVFYTHEVQKTVLPRYNRIVIFNAGIIHAVHPLSKSFKGLRKTLMFKIENISYEELLQNAA